MSGPPDLFMAIFRLLCSNPNAFLKLTAYVANRPGFRPGSVESFCPVKLQSFRRTLLSTAFLKLAIQFSL